MSSSSVSTDTRSTRDLTYEELLTADWQSCNERLGQNLTISEENQALRYRDYLEQEMCSLSVMFDGTIEKGIR